MGRQLLPILRQDRGVVLDAALALRGGELVGLREDQPKGDSVFAQEVDKLEVDLLRFEADIHQHEEEVHLLALEDVVGDDLREGTALRLRGARVAVAGQIDQIPAVVDTAIC